MRTHLPDTGGGGYGRIALSTMWAQRFPEADLTPFFEAGRGMGFDRFELGHALPPAAVDGIVPGSVRIESVHHPCPRDVAHGETVLSPSKEQRRVAADGIANSLRLANRLGARAVVFHLGTATARAPDLAGLAFELVSRYRAGQSGTGRYREVRLRVADRLREVETSGLEAAAESLSGPLALANSLGLALAFETGHDPAELPTPAGARALLRAGAAQGLSAWLDTGHLAAQEALRLATLDQWLDAIGSAWAGAHVHDAVGLRDHLPPGSGVVDVARAVAALPAGACVTLEVDWYLEPDEVRGGADALASLIGGP